jgi:2-polyprenyl-3-methyl-5-hydroxy-6-metoxy-1,4-benzoquinol methylase
MSAFRGIAVDGVLLPQKEIRRTGTIERREMSADNQQQTSATDGEWRKWGAQNPYRGVLGVDTVRMANPVVRSDFFSSGEMDVRRALKALEFIARGFSIADAEVLDFGCGVGRLMAAFASRCRSVTGVDVSPTMIGEATRNLASHDNVSFFAGLNEIPEANRYDLVHSHIVLQHIRPRQGMRVIEQLLDRVRDGGCFALQFTMGSTNPVRNLANWARYRLPPLQYAYNFVTRRPIGEPVMELNAYDLHKVLALTEKRSFSDCIVFNHGGATYRGVMVVGRKLTKRERGMNEQDHRA